MDLRNRVRGLLVPMIQELKKDGEEIAQMVQAQSDLLKLASEAKREIRRKFESLKDMLEEAALDLEEDVEEMVRRTELLTTQRKNVLLSNGNAISGSIATLKDEKSLTEGKIERVIRRYKNLPSPGAPVQLLPDFNLGGTELFDRLAHRLLPGDLLYLQTIETESSSFRLKIHGLLSPTSSLSMSIFSESPISSRQLDVLKIVVQDAESGGGKSHEIECKREATRILGNNNNMELQFTCSLKSPKAAILVFAFLSHRQIRDSPALVQFECEPSHGGKSGLVDGLYVEKYMFPWKQIHSPQLEKEDGGGGTEPNSESSGGDPPSLNKMNEFVEEGRSKSSYGEDALSHLEKDSPCLESKTAALDEVEEMSISTLDAAEFLPDTKYKSSENMPLVNSESTTIKMVVSTVLSTESKVDEEKSTLYGSISTLECSGISRLQCNDISTPEKQASLKKTVDDGVNENFNIKSKNSRAEPEDESTNISLEKDCVRSKVECEDDCLKSKKRDIIAAILKFRKEGGSQDIHSSISSDKREKTTSYKMNTSLDTGVLSNSKITPNSSFGDYGTTNRTLTGPEEEFSKSLLLESPKSPSLSNGRRLSKWNGTDSLNSVQSII